MPKIPDEIMREVVRQQEEMGWPDCVPRRVELPPDPVTRKVLWHYFATLSVAQCEQLVEHHIRRARACMQTLRWTPSGSGLKRIAHHILYARLFRCNYISLIGQENSTEDDMPFAHNEWGG